MWIKASGKWLSRANQEEIFVNLDLNILNQILLKSEIIVNKDVLIDFS